MSNASFVAAMAPYAAQAAAATGLRCELFLTQWAYESAWGTSQVASHNNFAGIESPSAGKGCTCCIGGYTICPTTADFTALYIAILEQGIYAPVRATAGQSLDAQCTALGNSPWAAGHYTGTCGIPGCGLIELYNANAALIGGACGHTPPPTCSPACVAPLVCNPVTLKCEAQVPPPSPSGAGVGLLLVAGVLVGAYAWEHRECLAAEVQTLGGGGGFSLTARSSSGRRVRRGDRRGSGFA